MALLEIHEISRHFDGVAAVERVSFSVAQGETVSVIGPNGAGKTTLFNLITGLDRPTDGDIRFEGRSLIHLSPARVAERGIVRTFQHGRVFGNLSVLDNVLIGAHTRRRVSRFSVPGLGALAELFTAIIPIRPVKKEERQLRGEAEQILGLFGERLLPRINEPAYSLSYANRRRLELARALALHPRLLLLDEPTAGMNPTETAEMLAFIKTLKRSGLTMLLIEHKLDLVMEVSDRVVVMDNGLMIAEGLPGQVRANPRVIEAYLGRKQAAREGLTEVDLASPTTDPTVVSI